MWTRLRGLPKQISFNQIESPAQSLLYGELLVTHPPMKLTAPGPGLRTSLEHLARDEGHATAMAKAESWRITVEDMLTVASVTQHDALVPIRIILDDWINQHTLDSSLFRQTPREL